MSHINPISLWGGDTSRADQCTSVLHHKVFGRRDTVVAQLTQLGASPLTTKGDLFTYGTGNTRQAVSAQDGNVLVSDSTATNGIAYASGLVDGSNATFDYDDFGGGDLSIGSGGGTKTGWFSTTKAAGSASTIGHTGVVGFPTMVGVLSLQTGTSTTGTAGVWGLQETFISNNQMVFGSTGQIEITYWIGTDANLSTAGDRYVLSGGLNDGTLVLAGNNFIRFAYAHDVNGGKFVLQVSVATATTTTNGTTTVAINTGYVIKLVVDSARTKVDMYVTTYGTPFPTSPEATFTGTLPAAATLLSSSLGITKTAGTNSRTLYADRWQVVKRVRR